MEYTITVFEHRDNESIFPQVRKMTNFELRLELTLLSKLPMMYTSKQGVSGDIARDDGQAALNQGWKKEAEEELYIEEK